VGGGGGGGVFPVRSIMREKRTKAAGKRMRYAARGVALRHGGKGGEPRKKWGGGA